MTLVEMLRQAKTLEVSLASDGPEVVVLAIKGAVDGRSFSAQAQVEDIKFNTGGAITMVHALVEKPAEEMKEGWTCDPNNMTCEACQ